MNLMLFQGLQASLQRKRREKVTIDKKPLMSWKYILILLKIKFKFWKYFLTKFLLKLSLTGPS